MDKLLEIAVTQVPNMVIMAVVVIAFIKYIGRRDKMMEELQRENNVARELSRQVIEKNTVAATQNTESMHNMTAVLKEFLKRNR